MTRKITHLATGQGQYDGHVVHRLYVAYDDNTLWLRNEEGCWNELDQPPFTAPPEGVADQNENADKARWISSSKWACLREDGADAHLHVGDIIQCACGTLRPPRPAGEAAQ